MNWISIVGLSMIIIGTILSAIGASRSDAEAQKKMEAKIDEKNTKIFEIREDNKTIREQNSDLMIASKFISQTNTKLIEQNEETKRAMYLQGFESSFFVMHSNLKELSTSIKAVKNTKVFTGVGLEIKEVIKTELTGLKSFEVYNEVIYEDTPYPPIRDYQSAQSYYTYNPNLKAPFEAYYISLATLLNYAENSDLSPSQKMKYFERVISPMEFFQKKALFYHIALSNSGQNRYDDDLRKLEKKYQFLKDLHRLERIAHTYNHNHFM